MREIKFRAYDLLESNLGIGIVNIFEERRVHVIFESDEIPSYKGKDMTIAKWRHNSIGMKHCEVMQYTGLKDKNGVEIYEFMELDNNFEVSFKDGCYVLINISNGDIILLYNYIKDKNGQVEITKEYTKV